MTILDLHKEKTLFDFYSSYVEEIKQTTSEKGAKAAIAKLQTGWIRYVLPGLGFPLKLKGKLIHEEVAKAHQFMQGVSLCQADQALEVQQQVFQQFGDRISPEVQRVYRSVVRKSLEWGRQQDFWEISLGNRAKDRAPAMLPPRGSLKPRYSIQKTQYNETLQKEIEHLCAWWQSTRVPTLKQDSIRRYLKDINCLLGWLHHVKAVPIKNLSLYKIVPLQALSDEAAAQQVTNLAQEYLEWLQVERENQLSTQLFAWYSFVHISEYIHYAQSVACIK